jgi:xanthine dehydrogenase YagS FAD-binding subunit
MKSFEYAAPRNLKDATELLAEKWGETEILAGGTDLVTCLKQGLTAPNRVVSLKNVAELKGIKSDRRTRIGATTTLAELVANKPSRRISRHRHRERNRQRADVAVGTVGGDLCQRPRCWYFRNGLGLFVDGRRVSSAGW